MSDRRRTLLRVGGTLAVLLISGGILGYLVYSQRELLSEIELRIQPLALFGAFVFFSLDLWLVAWIWSRIMNALGGQRSTWEHIRAYSISNLARRIPGTVWYIAGRAQIYREAGIPAKLTAGASAVELAIATLTSAVIALVFGIATLLDNSTTLVGLGILLALSLAASHPKIIGWAFKRAGIEASPFRYRQVLGWIFTYLFAWIISGVVVYTISRIFIEIEIDQVWYIVGSVSLVNVLTTLLFFAPTNLGITEVTLSLLLARIMPASYAVLVSIATRALIIMFEAFWAVLWIWLGRGRITKLTQRDY